jgi:Acetyltransferase (GNAT) family.
MNILHSSFDDIDSIFKIYDDATEYQKKQTINIWKGFERSLVQKEIEEKRQYKIMVDGEIACVFVINYDDPLIWKERNADPSIYIHRIATNPLFRGGSFVKQIVEWAKDHAKETGKEFIRMDTFSGNDKLNNYYFTCGFADKGITQIGLEDDLPAHYRGGSINLFEIKL